MLASVIWGLLPATAVVLQFAGTRHYLEGLLFALLSTYLLIRMKDVGGRPAKWLFAAAIACAAVSMLYKEIYAASVPLLLIATAWRRRAPGPALAAIALSAAYATYRIFVLGLNLHYSDIQILGGIQYLRCLSKFPYTISADYGGYLLYGVVMLACVALMRDRVQRPIAGAFLVLFVISMLVIVPVSYPLFGRIRLPDPWYRIVFLPHSLAVFFGAYFAARFAPWRVQIPTAVATLAILMPGVTKTHDLWEEMTASAEREGRFYLNNPDKILLSEREAWWFIPGVHWVYGIAKPHYVLAKDLSSLKLDMGPRSGAITTGRSCLITVLADRSQAQLMRLLADRQEQLICSRNRRDQAERSVSPGPYSLRAALPVTAAKVDPGGFHQIRIKKLTFKLVFSHQPHPGIIPSFFQILQ